MNIIKTLILIITIVFFNTFSYGQTLEDIENNKIKGRLSKVDINSNLTIKEGDELVVGLASGDNKYIYLAQNNICNWGGNKTTNECSSGYSILNPSAVGSKIKIKKLTGKKGKLIVIASNSIGNVYNTRILSFKSALETGEIEILGYKSKAQAINELKGFKEQLDLGLISDEEYETKKKELIEFIK